MNLRDIQNKILHGPHTNAEKLSQQKDKQLAAGVDCKLVYLEDIKSFAVVRCD